MLTKTSLDYMLSLAARGEEVATIVTPADFALVMRVAEERRVLDLQRRSSSPSNSSEVFRAVVLEPNPAICRVDEVIMRIVVAKLPENATPATVPTVFGFESGYRSRTTLPAYLLGVDVQAPE